MRGQAWAVGLFAVAGCSHPSPPKNPSTAGATLVVTLLPSQEVPTGIRMELSNPGTTPVPFCRYQTPFEGVMDDIFEVRLADGTELPFRGPILQYAECESGEWFTVQPGRFHTAEVDLADGYPMQVGQTYMVRYRGSSVSTLPASDWLDLIVE